MDRADYSVWMALLLAPLLVFVTVPALRRQATREREARLFRLLTWALVLKLAGALLRFYVAFGLYGGAADAASYHEWGTDISASFRSGVLRDRAAGPAQHPVHPALHRTRVHGGRTHDSSAAS